MIEKSKIYKKKRVPGSPGTGLLTQKFAWVARIMDTLKANLRIDVDHK